MNEVRIDKVVRYLPTTWDELTAEQLRFACSLFNLPLTTIQFKLSLLFKFLKVKVKLWNTISGEDAYFMCETLNFILDEVKLTKALVKSIRSPRFPWIRYYGPSDGMVDCTFGEFTKAQVRYEQYGKTSDPAVLDEMVAILFRRKKLFWFIQRHFLESPDPRARFMDRTLAGRAKGISPVDPAIKKAVMLFFSGVQSTLPAKFPHVYKEKPGKKGDNSGWSNLIISLADGKTDDQSLDRVMNSNLYNVFLGLEQKSIEYFEFLKKYPQND